jgi:glycosyltransferase involved in cell wall biosynthesis
MKIATIVNTFPPYWSGTGLAALHLARAMGQRGHEIHIFTPKPAQPADFSTEPFHLHYQKTIFRIGMAPLTPGLFALNGFDLFHLHFPYYFGAEMTALTALLQKKQLFITYHNDVTKPGLSGYITNIHSQTIAPVLLQSAVCVFAMSREFYTQSNILSHLPPEKIKIIPQGIDTERFTATVPPPDAQKPYILFVRALDAAHHHSGLDVLLNALPAIDTSLHLYIVGEGELRSNYENLAHQNGLDGRTHFLGAIPNSDLPGWYSGATAFVLPSTTTENASLVLLEAMACGTPVIASAIGGTPELVQDGITGLLVPPRDASALAKALESIIKNPAWGKNMGHTAAKWTRETRSWKTVAAQVEEIFQKNKK